MIHENKDEIVRLLIKTDGSVIKEVDVRNHRPPRLIVKRKNRIFVLEEYTPDIEVYHAVYRERRIVQ